MEEYVYRSFSEFGNPEDPNGAVVNYYQYGYQDVASMTILGMMENYIYQFMYKYLRTDRELGYIVSATLTQHSCIQGFIIYAGKS